MQTYELTPGRMIDDVLRDLSEIGSSDKDITLVVPAGDELLSQVENLSRLRRFVQAQNLNLRAVVVDRVTLGLFRIMGFEVDEVQSEADDDYEGALEDVYGETDAVVYAPAGGEWSAENDGAYYDGSELDAESTSQTSPLPELRPLPPSPSPMPQPQVANTVAPNAAPNVGAMKLKMKIKTQYGTTVTATENGGQQVSGNGYYYPETVESAQRPVRPLTPEEIVPPVVGPIVPEQEVPVPVSDTVDPDMTKWDVQSSMAASSEPSDEEEKNYQAEGNTLSGLDVTLPNWLNGEHDHVPAPGATNPSLNVSMPSWMAQENGSDSTQPAAPAHNDQPSMPAWLHETSTGAPAAPASVAPQPAIPAWLREESAPPAPRPANVLPVNGAPAAASAPATPSEPTIGPRELRDAAVAQAGGSSLEGRALPPLDIAAIGGVPQPGAGGKDGGLDSRTRALILFGMALIRLASSEAQAAVAAARHHGASEEDLKLVIQMSQAIGGGPSERLGRRILGS